MNIKTFFFGISTDFVGTSELHIDVEENTSVKDFKSVLKERFAQLENINTYAIAVNEEYATDDLLLKLGDVVAVIPSVSGG
jgi:molybdopterin converting factor subunit 1